LRFPRIHQRRFSPADVVSHRGVHARKIADFQGGDDFLVLGLLGGEAYFDFLRGARILVGVAFGGVDAGNGQVGIEALVDFGEAAISGSFDQQEMEFTVGALVLAQRFFTRHRLTQQFNEVIEFVQVGRPDALHRFLRGQTFKGDADIEGGVNVVEGERSNERTTAGFDFDEAFGGQLLYGVPHGREANAEPVGDLIDLQPFTGFEEPIQDGIPEVFINLVGRALSSQAA